jgi:hypothetical protein
MKILFLFLLMASILLASRYGTSQPVPRQIPAD